MQMRKNWWKYLGILLMIYTISAGLLIPLKSGITEVYPTRLNTGAIYDLSISGYNTQFTQPGIQVFLRLDRNNQLEASSLDIQTNQKMIAHFEIPDKLVGEESMADATLVVLDGEGDYAIYPVLRILQSGENDNNGTASWGNVLVTPQSQWRFAFPYRNILVETIRNTFFHVAIWMAMFILLLISVVFSIKYLRKGSSYDDHWASSFTYVSIVFGIIGVITGSIWARYTWGAFWTNDVKLNMVAISMMIYLAYGILRSSIDDNDKRAKSAAIYNIFAFCAMIPLVMIIPRLTASLHPGNGGNPAMGGEDLDSTLRLVFYPAIIGLALIGSWIAQLWYRIKVVEERIINNLLKELE